MAILQVLAIVVVILLLAFMIETLVEALLGKPLEKAGLKSWTWALMYVAVAVGIAAAWFYQFDLIYLLGSFLEDVIGQPIMIPSTSFGVVVTGISIGMGSAYIHDLLKRFFRKDVIEQPPEPLPGKVFDERVGKVIR
jgi:hypothetical protein